MGKAKSDLQYGIDDVPPWYFCILLGFQHYLTMFGAAIALPLVVTPALCLVDDEVARSEIIGTTFFVSGLVTLLQSTFGVRLPIVQGGTFAFLSPVLALMSLPEWKCSLSPVANGTIDTSSLNGTITSTAVADVDGETDAPWLLRMREVQGAIILASMVQVFIGVSGAMGPLLRYIGPLTIAPTITLIGIVLFETAATFCGAHWGIACFTLALIIIFSQYLRNVDVPCWKYERRQGCTRQSTAVFKLFPVILSILMSWLLCYILTASGALPDSSDQPGYGARTDTKLKVLRDASWFRIPYPGQWGMPTFSAAGVLGMLAGVVAGMIESIGDYYACARLAGAPPPPVHAINRGVMVEGLGCVVAGLFGTGSGTTSYSENIGAIGVTKVGSRRVIQAGGCVMVVFGVLGKFGALFVTIPDPVVGGVFMVMFGMITAVGVSNLQFVNLNSSRNLFIFGFAVFAGITIPHWITSHAGAIATGVPLLDQVITVLLTTGMFVGGSLGFFLDNTIPADPGDRLEGWGTELTSDTKSDSSGESELHPDSERHPVTGPYDFPCGMSFIRAAAWTKYIPVCPTHTGCDCCKRRDEEAGEHRNATDANTDDEMLKEDDEMRKTAV